MKLSYNILIISLVLVVLSVGAVSAAENASDVQLTVESDDSAVSHDDVAVESIGSNDDNVISSDVSKENKLGISHNFTGTTFSQLQTLINSANQGDTIVLKNDVVQNGTSLINIAKSITINGENHIVDAQNKSNIFYLAADNICLNNIIFKNFRCSYNNPTIDIRCNNTEISNCDFINSNGTGYIIQIGNYGKLSYNFTICDCNFINILYGCINIYCNNATISECNFINNTNYAIHMVSGSCLVSRCNFTDNAMTQNGAIIDSFASIIIKDSIFSNCSNFVRSGSSYGDAIAINLYNAYNCEISNCSFINCNGTSSHSKCTVNVRGGENFTFLNCNFTNCSGAFKSSGKNVVISNSTFENGYYGYYQRGSAIYFEGGDANISNCIFKNNTCNQGGAIYAYSGSSQEITLAVYNCSFINNSATSIGGAISASRNVNLNISNSYFDNNKANSAKTNDVHISDTSNIILNDIRYAYNHVNIIVLDNSTTLTGVGFNKRLIAIIKDDENNTRIPLDKLQFILPDGTLINASVSEDGEIWSANYKFHQEGNYQISAKLTDFDNFTIYKGSVDVIVSDFYKLQKLIDDAEENSEINLTQNYTYLSGDSNIKINKSLTINGNGFTINGGGESYNPFNIESDNVTLRNITFTNFKYGVLSSRRYNNLTICDCVFKNNKANGMEHVINLEECLNVTVKNCKFINTTSAYQRETPVDISIHWRSSCYLENNHLSGSIVVEDGVVLSKTKVIILENTTVYCPKNNITKITAVITDDNNNLINARYDANLKFVLENGTVVSASCDYYSGVWNGQYTFTDYGDYLIKATYSNTTFVDATVYLGIVAIREITELEIPTLENITKGNATVEIKVPKNLTGNITVTIDGKNYTAPINNGTARVDLSNVTAGNHTAIVTYSGDDINSPNSTNVNITIDKKPTTPADINITDLGNTTAGNATLVIKVPDDLTGNITVTIDDKNYTTPITNGTAKIDLSNLTSGEYNATITYGGDENNDPVSKNITIKIDKPDLDLQVTITEGNDTTPTVIDISVPVDFDGIITVKINGDVQTVPITAGKGSVSFNLGYNNYTAYINAVNSTRYNDYSITKNISIIDPRTPLNPESIINITNSSEIDLNLPKDANGTVYVYIDNIIYKNITVTNGTADPIILTNMTPGNHTVVIQYSGDNKYQPVNKTFNVTVPKPVITLKGADMVVLYSGELLYKVQVLSDGKNITDGTNITIIYNNNKFTVQTKGGYATLLLQSELKPDTYKVTANYTNITTTNNIVIKNIINAKKLKKLKKSKKVNKVKASLIKVDGKYLVGKKLTLKIKGKKVATAKTNKKGTATFKVKKKKLKKFKKGKKYTASVIYGQDIYNKKIKIK